MADDTTPPIPKRHAKSLRAEATFRARLAELGATLLEPEWLGSVKPHRVRCAQGHDCAPWPSSVGRGQGICRLCAGATRAKALTRRSERVFRDQLDALGATLLEPEWLGTLKPHRVRCVNGHDCAPWPSSLVQGQGICLVCVGNDPKVAEAEFRARVAELGATLLEPVWLGNNTPHRVRCHQGHECTPRPNHVRQGRDVCRICRHRVWDIFYVVQDPTVDVIKIGITSGNALERLRKHERDGFDQVVRLAVGLSGDTAPVLERTILAALGDVREKPVRGREYFPARVLPLVLDLVDNHPAIRTA